MNKAIDWARAHCGMYSVCGEVITVDQVALAGLVTEVERLRHLMDEPLNASGLTPDEQMVMDAICLATARFFALPAQHPSEARDFVDAVHRIQDLLAVRVCRRTFPDGWPTFSETACRRNSGDHSHGD